MFDISWQELLLIMVVALLIIPPKDLPRAMHIAGKWMRQVKTLGRELQANIDELAREAELAELKRHTEETVRKANAEVNLNKVIEAELSKPETLHE
jgi:sec-independent protein translocase protein TatB